MARHGKSISVKSFLNLLKKGDVVQSSWSVDDKLVLEDWHFTDQLNLSKIFIDGDLIIKNCRFNDSFWLSEIEIDGNFEICNSIIKGYLNKAGRRKGGTLNELKVRYEFNIKNVEAPDIIYLTDSGLESLNLIESKLQGGLSLYSNTIDYNISIQHSSIEVLRAEENKVGDSCEMKHLQCGHVHFIDNEIKQNVQFEQVTVLDNFYFENDKARYLGFDQVETQNLWLDKVHINSELNLQNIKAEKIWIFSTKVSGDTKITGIAASKEVHLNGGHFRGDVFVSEVQTAELSIDGTSNEGRFILQFDPREDRSSALEYDQLGLLNIGSGSYGKGMALMLETFMLPKLQIMNSKSFEGLIGVAGGIIDEVFISGINNSGVLNLQGCLVNVLHIEQVLNEGSLTFSEIKPVKDNSKFTIEKAVLGRASFVNMDMSRFASVQICNSLLDDIKYSNVQWFHPDNLNKDYYGESLADLSPQKKVVYLGNQREVFRQLKFAAEKQGDRTQSLNFKVQEYRVYKEILAYNIASFRSVNPYNGNLWQLRAELWSLNLGLWTNRLGQNWLRPLVQITCITFLFFPLFIIAASPTLTWWPFGNELAISETLTLFWDQRGVLPQLFNPTRYLSRVFGTESLPGDIYFIDALHRIVLAFYIYQIISAFRKYFK